MSRRSPSGADPAPLIAAAAAGLPGLIVDGLAHWDGRRIAVTGRGRPFVRAIATLFDAYLACRGDAPRHPQPI